MSKIIGKRLYKFFGEVIFLSVLCLLLYGSTSFATGMTGEIDLHQVQLPSSNDAFIIHFKAQGLNASSDHLVKGRIKQGSSYLGSTWNSDTSSWRKQSDSWTSMPTLRSNASGEIESYINMKSSASLLPHSPATIEITLRQSGASVNLGPITSATLDIFDLSATGDGIYLSGRAFTSSGEPAIDKLLIGKDGSNDPICVYSTENNTVLEGSVDIPGAFLLPCPMQVRRLEMFDRANMGIMGSFDITSTVSPGDTVYIEINGGTKNIGPEITIMSQSAQRLAREDTLSVDISASNAIYTSGQVSMVQYAIDGSPSSLDASIQWENAVPSDGSYDSNEETVEISIPMQEFSTGVHQLLFRAIDNEGNFGPTRTAEFKVYDTKFLDARHGTEFYFSQSSGDCVFRSKDGTVLFEDKCKARSQHKGIILIKERADSAFLFGSLDLNKNKAHLILIKKSTGKKVFIHHGR